MPEQLTKHPEVTLQVLRSGGARCGEGLPQQILQQCPAERFCQLPGGEICVYGLPEAGRMTQVSAAEWRALFAPAPVPEPPAGAAAPVVAGTVKFSMNGRIRWNDASFGALVAAFPNTGFMGVPLLVAPASPGGLPVSGRPLPTSGEACRV